MINPPETTEDGLAIPPSWDVQEANRKAREANPKRDEFGDTAAAVSAESFEAAKERFMKAGSREGTAGLLPESDSKLVQAYQSAVGYLADTGLAGLELSDAAFKYALGIASEAIPGQGNNAEERFVRDAYSMPEAFMGAPVSGVRELPTRLDDVLMGGKMAGDDLLEAMPKHDPNTASMFLGVRAKGADLDALGKAKTMDMDDVAREQIWKDTGWFKFNGEWLYEIDDSKSEIALTAKQKGLDKLTGGPGKTITRTEEPRIKDRLAVQNRYQQQAREIRNAMRKGELSDTDGMAKLQQLQNEMDGELANLTRTITTTTPGTTKHPAANLKTKGMLDDVLFHPSLKDHMDIPADTTAEAGQKIYKKPNIYGQYYPQVNSDAAIKKEGDSRVNAYKNAGTPDGIWSTFLHETQHLVDDLSKSGMNGYNDSYAKNLKAKLETRVDQQRFILADSEEFETARKRFQTRVGKTVSSTHLSKAMLKLAEGNPEAAGTILAERLGGPTAARVHLRTAMVEGDFAEAMPMFQKLTDTKAYRISNKTPFAIYAHEGGEVKSRMTQARRNMSAEERKQNAPWKTLQKMDSPVLEDDIFAESDFNYQHYSEGPMNDTDDLEKAKP